MVLHLKRWAYNAARNRWDKVDTPVAYQELFPLDAHTFYDLRGVVVHEGHVNGGHYTAYVRSQNGNWFFCNDRASPAACDLARVLSAEAYMLFYERR